MPADATARPAGAARPDHLIGRRVGPVAFDYDARAVVLYALSVGARPEHLPLLNKGVEGGLRILPTFCFTAMHSLSPYFTDLVREYRKVEASERLRVHRRLSVPGQLQVSAEITDVFDKGSLALLRCRVTGHDEDGGEAFELVSTSALLGAGDFGGDRGPVLETPPLPESPADVTAQVRVPENQAHLYQLNGVDDPIHVDPEFARTRGFERPILHGPATFGYAALTLVDELCEHRPERLREIEARFSAPVFPGDTLTIEIWRGPAGEHGTEAFFRVATERGAVLTHGLARIDDPAI